MRYEKVNPNLFQHTISGAFILLRDFDTETGVIDPAEILAATTEDTTFTASPTWVNRFERINGINGEYKEGMHNSGSTITFDGTAISSDDEFIRDLTALAGLQKSGGSLDSPTTLSTIVPRTDVLDSDFKDIWVVTNYGDNNSELSGGFLAIHLKNALSVNGLQIRGVNNDYGTFPFSYKAFKTLEAQTEEAYEIFIRRSTDSLLD